MGQRLAGSFASFAHILAERFVDDDGENIGSCFALFLNGNRVCQGKQQADQGRRAPRQSARPAQGAITEQNDCHDGQPDYQLPRKNRRKIDCQHGLARDFTIGPAFQ